MLPAPVTFNEGAGNTETLTDGFPTQPFASVTMQVYTPLFAVLLLGIIGFAMVELNPPGPDHEKVTPPVAAQLIVFPSHALPVIAAVAAILIVNP